MHRILLLWLLSSLTSFCTAEVPLVRHILPQVAQMWQPIAPVDTQIAE